MVKHRNWSEESLKTAIAAVRSGSSVRSASAMCGIPRHWQITLGGEVTLKEVQVHLLYSQVKRKMSFARE